MSSNNISFRINSYMVTPAPTPVCNSECCNVAECKKKWPNCDLCCDTYISDKDSCSSCVAYYKCKPAPTPVCNSECCNVAECKKKWPNCADKCCLDFLTQQSECDECTSENKCKPALRPRKSMPMQFINANHTNTTNFIGYRNTAVRRAVRRRAVINCCAKN